MCPVYLEERRYSEKSEIYSYGVVVLECIVGRLTSSSREGNLVWKFVSDCYGSREEELEDYVDGYIGKILPVPISELCHWAKKCVGQFKQRPTTMHVMRSLIDIEASTGHSKVT